MLEPAPIDKAVTAEIISLSSYRAAKVEGRPAPEPVNLSFYGREIDPETQGPGDAFCDMFHALRSTAEYLRKGGVSVAAAANLVARLSANASLACRTGRELDLKIIRAERVISAQNGGIDGKALSRFIKEQSDRVRNGKKVKKQGKG